MNFEKAIAKIKRIDWYRQGGAVLPFYSSQCYRTAFEYYDGFNLFKEKDNYGYFDKNKQKKIAYRIVKKQLKDGNYFEDSLIKPWEKKIKKFNEFNKEIILKILSKLYDEKLIELFNKFGLLRYNLWKYCVLIEAFDPNGDKIIKENLEKYNLDINPEDLALLTGPRKLTFVQKELIDRAKIKNKAIMLKHVKKYYWIHNTWAEVRYLDEKYFTDLIKNNQINKERIKELENFEYNIKLKVKELYKKYNFPEEIKNLLHLFSRMTDWRDERKAQIFKTNCVSDLFLQEFSKRTGIKHDVLLYLYDEEVKSISHIKSLEGEFKKRIKGSVLCYTKSGFKWFTGKEAEKITELLEKTLMKDELRGTVANKGKAKGYVKIITTPKDFSKFRKGDIIVTQMTRPEFTPILDKAAAIVTEEGGVTCHAAIVSRELDIPCILGTQIAKSVLKDGDYIEVDANRGIVRKVVK